jgi:hypothetical protein
MSTYVPVAQITLSSAANQITFTNIPQTYTDLIAVMRGGYSTGANASLRINNDSTSLYSRTQLKADSTTLTSGRESNYASFRFGSVNTGDQGNNILLFQSYSSTTKNKSFLSEENSVNAGSWRQAGLYRSNNPITRLDFFVDGGPNFLSGYNITLYGIGSGTLKATGGEIYIDGTTAYHVFKQSGLFTPFANLTADVLLVAGGGGADNGRSGGGGAGGLLALTSQSLTPQTYPVLVGAGGTGRGTLQIPFPTSGSNSQFGAFTAAIGGGAGGLYADAAYNGLNGGSGGGGSVGAFTGQGLGGSPTSGQGNSGGNSINKTNAGGGWTAGGGGGGAGAAGQSASGNGAGSTTQTPGNGGNGSSAYSAWGVATNTGENISGTRWYAGGGASIGINSGGANLYSTTGNGNGGNNSTAPIATTGGGGSAGTAASGAAGVVIVRYTL